MANPEHFGTVVRYITSKWGTNVEILPEDSPLYAEGETYKVPADMIKTVDLGHGGTRIVTEEAYQTHRAEMIAKFVASVNKS